MFTYPIMGTPADFLPTDVAGLELWLDASNRGVTTNQWDDLSGNGNHFTSASAPEFPTFAGGWATFTTSQFCSGPGWQGTAAAEIFIRCESDAESGGALGPPMDFDFTGASDHYKYTDNHIYNGFGSDTRKDCGDQSSFALTDPHTLNVWSAAFDWSLQLDGVTKHSDSNPGVVTFHTGSYIGRSGYQWGGKIAAVLFYTNKVSIADRAALEAYLAGL